MGQTAKNSSLLAKSALKLAPETRTGLDGVGKGAIPPKPEPRSMQYQLSDYEWRVIRPMLLNNRRGVPRVDVAHLRLRPAPPPLPVAAAPGRCAATARPGTGRRAPRAARGHVRPARGA